MKTYTYDCDICDSDGSIINSYCATINVAEHDAPQEERLNAFAAAYSEAVGTYIRGKSAIPASVSIVLINEGPADSSDEPLPVTINTLDLIRADLKSIEQ